MRTHGVDSIYVFSCCSSQKYEEIGEDDTADNLATIVEPHSEKSRHFYEKVDTKNSTGVEPGI